MNLLILKPEYFTSENVAVVQNEQALHLFKIKKVQPGDNIPVGVLGGRIGRGIITETSRNRVELEIELLSKEVPLPPVDIVLALPRPQILKRVFFNCAMMGVRKLFLVGASRVDKSYFQSSELLASNIEKNTILGLEQGMGSIAPEISVHSNFVVFVRDIIPIMGCQGSGEVRLLPHPEQKTHFSETAICRDIDNNTQVMLAVGPEGGWQVREIEALKGVGFSSFHIGPRILRVDTAISVLLGQIDLLRKLRATEN